MYAYIKPRKGISAYKHTFLLNGPSGPIQSISRNVHDLSVSVCVSVCAIAENLLPGGLETSGQKVYR